MHLYEIPGVIIALVHLKSLTRPLISYFFMGLRSLKKIGVV